jgi:isopentenyl diphosphate isomerase/L-lactate dehydrogenase-like FMN-dependent dehydrogenase
VPKGSCVSVPWHPPFKIIDPNIFSVGRPWLYGSIVAGQAGIEQVIKHTVAELDHTLGLAGHSSLDAIRGQSKSILVNMNAS